LYILRNFFSYMGAPFLPYELYPSFLGAVDSRNHFFSCIFQSCFFLS
jgi:hypothetical protein